MSEPPRPIASGDVVTTHHEGLGAWVAGQVTHVDPKTRMVAVLELDWSGPQPSSVADLGQVSPLRLTHHSWNGTLEHTWVRWVLPRSHRVLGSLPLLVTSSTNTFAFQWRLGFQLGLQRRWDSGLGDEEPATDRVLRVSDIDSLDCADLVADHPDLVDLSLSGRPGTLTNAAALNGLTRLRSFDVTELFGMTAADCLQPSSVPELEVLSLHPLRDWDGRPGISARNFKKAVAQHKTTRRAVLAALASGEPVFELGSSFGSAFNGLEYIETVEREELFAALDAIVDEAESALGVDLTSTRDSLASGVDAVRDW